MTPWSDYALTVIAQVSAISLAALAVATCSYSNAARRHAVGVLGLILVLSSPLAAILLPQADWWRAVFSGSPAESPNATPQREPTPFAPVQFEPPNEARVVPVEGKQPAAEPSLSSFGQVDYATPPSRSEEPFATPENANDGDARDGAWRRWSIRFVGCIWLVGSAVSAGMWTWRSRRLRRLARSLNLVLVQEHCGSEVLMDGANTSFVTVAREVCEAVGLRELPPVAVSEGMPMPLVLGVWSPTIVLPCELLQAGAETRLRDVLIHEAAHVARRDPWINLAQWLAAVLWWWHPGVLGLNRIITRSREEVCDNFVLTRSDASQYAQTLLELAEKCAQAGRLVPSLGLLESRWTLEARICGLLKPGREMMTRTKRRAVAIIAVLLGAVCFLIGGAGAVEDDREPARPSKEAHSRHATAGPAVESDSANKLRRIIVRGRCVDDQSRPLANVRVLIVRRTQDYISQVIEGETRTDADGRFELRDVETAMLNHGDLFAAAAREGNVSTCVQLPNPEDGVIMQELALESNPGTLSGVVSDQQGRPIPGVTVYLSCCVVDDPLPGVRSAVTDENGRYAITDLKRWEPKDTETFDPKTGTGTIVVSCSFRLKHPDYPKSTANYSAVPQEVNVTLYPPAIVEGQVIDAVTSQPAAGVTVSAQGVARSGWYRTRTDAQGRYRLRMTKDHYNIWAEADDRIAVAVKAISAERGETVSDANIHLVRGGFVTGTVFGTDGRPISPTKESPHWMAHYGPARPRTGAAVTSTLVEPDGTYRLRVAPGRNYIYSMSGGGTSGYVTVEEGKEFTFDIHLGKKQGYQPEDEDQRLRRKLLEAARREDAESDSPDPKLNAARNASQPAPRKRPDTSVGNLLDELAEQNAGPDRFHDVWARTLKEIIELGPEAVPELIAELDATNDNMMLRCLGFALRAIDDKRAVPALIRAIPRTLVPPGSDMGLRAEDTSLAAFMQKHDLDDRDEGIQYGFGRPVREVFGALHQLTGHSFGDEQLYSIFAGGTARQQQLKQQLFARNAKKWADWWEENWKDYVEDSTYARVNLPEPRPVAETRAPWDPQQRLKTGSGGSGWVLGSYADPKTRQAFFDLDTGRAASLPAKWRQAENIEPHQEEIEAWAAQEGYDLMGTEYRSPEGGQRSFALRPLGLQAWELGEEYWKMTSSDVTFGSLQAEGTPAAGMLLHYDREEQAFAPEKTATFLFKTREGTPGLLFAGVEVRDDNLKPGGIMRGDVELQPVAFSKGRRFGWTPFEELPDDAAP